MARPYAMVVTALGGPEVLQRRDIEMPRAGANEVVIESTRISVNFADIYVRSGAPHSHQPKPPFVPGIANAGRVVEVGAGVAGLSIGDRVTFVGGSDGGYATHTAQPANAVVKIPDEVSDDRVAAAFARAMTAHYLLKQLRPLQAGQTVLIHAAAGGVGQILTQWAKRLDLVVIATAGSDRKLAFVRELGADHVLNYTKQDFAREVERITEGRGVGVVYDSVGKDTFLRSLECLAPLGLAVNYGISSGPVENFPLQLLHARSLSICRPTLKTFVASRPALEALSAETFKLLANPTLRVDIETRLPLSSAAQAHRLLEGRTMQGAVILVP